MVARAIVWRRRAVAQGRCTIRPHASSHRARDSPSPGTRPALADRGCGGESREPVFSASAGDARRRGRDDGRPMDCWPDSSSAFSRDTRQQVGPENGTSNRARGGLVGRQSVHRGLWRLGPCPLDTSAFRTTHRPVYKPTEAHIQSKTPRTSRPPPIVPHTHLALPRAPFPARLLVADAPP